MEDLVGNVRSRKLWLSIILHIIFFGLGHYYNSRLKRGLVLFLLYESLSIILFIAAIYYESVAMLIIFFIVSFGIWVVGLVDVVVIAKADKLTFRLKYYNNRWYKYLLAGIVILIFSHSIDKILENNIYDIARVWKSSMQNTLLDGDIILIRRFSLNRIGINDIIDFKSPLRHNTKLIKRFIAQGGQTVEIKYGDAYVDGKLMLVPSTALRFDSTLTRDDERFGLFQSNTGNSAPLKIPDNNIYVMGDNRSVSVDSRYFGPLNRNDVTGKVVFVLFSTTMKPDEDVGIIEKICEAALNIRWNRIGLIVR